MLNINIHCIFAFYNDKQIHNYIMAKEEKKYMDASLNIQMIHSEKNGKKQGLHGALFTTKKGTKCVLLPIEENSMHVTEKGMVYMPLRASIFEPDKYNSNGWVQKSPKMPDGKKYKDLTQEQKDAVNAASNFCGQVKILWMPEGSGGGQNAAPAITEMNEEDDDLPF